MSEMVERVARAIYEGRNGKGAKAWASQPGSHRAPYLLDARAALKQMRDHICVMRGDDGVIHELRGSPDDIWKAMIDAALKVAV